MSGRGSNKHQSGELFLEQAKSASKQNQNLWVAPATDESAKVYVDGIDRNTMQAIAEALKAVMEQHLGGYPDDHNKLRYRTNGGGFSNTTGETWLQAGSTVGDESGSSLYYTVLNENKWYNWFYANLYPTEFLGASRPLKWKNIDEDRFERLIFNLYEATDGIDDVQWVTKTRAPDKGKDISARRRLKLPLAPDRHEQLLIQCKHTPESSLSPSDIINMIGRVPLAQPPHVDVLVVVTSGRLTSQADELIEKHNADGKSPRVEKLIGAMLESVLLRNRPLVNGLGLL